MVKSEPAHSPYGPSSAERWLNCPASIRATKGLPDTDSDWSIEGTAAHALADRCSQNDVPAKSFLGKTVTVKLATGEKQEVKVDQEMVGGVQEFLDFCNGFEGYHLNETRVYYREYVPDGFGTTDRSVLAVAIGRVIDLKYGKGVQVFAADNEQLMLYALGIWLEWDWLYRFEKFILTIHQPRLDHVDSWEISVVDLLTWANEVLVPGYKATLEENARFNPGDWCRFCKIKATCRARAVKTFEVLQGEYEDISELHPRAPAELTPEELAEARKHFSNIKSWISAIEDRLYSELLNGRRPGELKLVNGKSSRVFVGDEKKIVKALVKAGADEKEIYEERSLKTPAAIEKIIGKPALKKLGAMVNTIPGKPTIASGDDRRPAITLDAETEFSVIGDE